MKNHVLTTAALNSVTSQIADLLQQRLTRGQLLYGHSNVIRRCSEYFGPGAGSLFTSQIAAINAGQGGTGRSVIAGNAALADAFRDRLNMLRSQPSIQSLVKLTTSQNGLDCLEGYMKQLAAFGGLSSPIQAVLVHLYKAHLDKNSACLFVSRWQRIIRDIQAMNTTEKQKHRVRLQVLQHIQSDAESLVLQMKAISIPVTGAQMFIPTTQGKPSAPVAML